MFPWLMSQIFQGARGVLMQIIFAFVALLILLNLGMWVFGLLFCWIGIMLNWTFDKMVAGKSWMLGPMIQFIEKVGNATGVTFTIPETEPTPEPVKINRVRAVLGMVNSLVTGLLDVVNTLEAEDAVAAAILVIAGVSCFWLASGKILYWTKRCSLRVRGIRYEAVREGSTATERSDPPYQVEVVSVGMLFTTAVGHGIRKGNILVVPMHVLMQVEGSLGLRGANGNVVVVSRRGVNSQCVRDTFYLDVPAKTFAELGVRSAPKAGRIYRERGTPVSISSKGNGTDGILRASATVGVVSYDATTLPGYSGAAYHDGQRWYGQHTGAMAAYNCGVAALVIEKELDKLMEMGVHESNMPSDFLNEQDRRKGWEEEEAVDRFVSKNYSSKSDKRAYMPQSLEEWAEWADSRGAELWTNEMDWESATPDQIQNVKASLKTKLTFLDQIDLRLRQKGMTPTVSTQGPGDMEIRVGPVDEKLALVLQVETDLRTHKLSVSREISTLKERVSCLEQNYARSLIPVESVEEPVGESAVEAVEVTCRLCGEKFPSKTLENRHYRQQHRRKVVEGAKAIAESSWPADFKQGVKTDKKGAFLEKRSGKTKSKPSPKPSQSKDKTGQSTELTESLLRMESSMEKFAKALELMQRAMVGQSSGTKQN